MTTNNVQNTNCWMCNGFEYKPSPDAVLCDEHIEVSKHFHKNYNYEELTDEGIYVHHVLSGELVRFLPNDDKVTILVREAKALWENGDKEGFTKLYTDKERRKDFTPNDNWVFKCTWFEGTFLWHKKTCISWIMEQYDIDENFGKTNKKTGIGVIY